MTVKEKEAYRDIVLGVIFVIFGIAVYIASSDITTVRFDPLGPAFMPRFLGILSALVSGGILISGIRKKIRITKEQETKQEGVGEEQKQLSYKKHPIVAFFSLCFFALFILAFDLGLSGFRTLSIIFMLILGGLLIKTSNTNKYIKHSIILVFLTLALSFGLHYVFTQVFVVNLH